MTCRLAIIDDDPAVVRMMQRIIEQQGLGTVAVTASNGRDAEALVMQHQPDVVVIDLLMPRQDGLHTVARLRRQGFGGAFIMLSHVKDKEMVAEAYQLGIEFFISKPLNLIEIVSVTRRVLESRSLRQALGSIQSTLSPLSGQLAAAGAAAAAPAAPAPAAPPLLPGAAAPTRRQQALRLLADLGILGEAGADDLVALAELPATAWAPAGALDLPLVYGELARHYAGGHLPESRSARVKSIEQRIRRAAGAALTHLAAIGLEDFSDPRFERLAPTFFDFGEVRAEMARLGGRGRAGGRVNLKKFCSAFLLELESPEGRGERS